MQAMILTAGKGNRLRPYTEILPKPAIPLLNVPLVCYGLELLRPLNLDLIVGNLHHLPDKMAELWKSMDVPTKALKLSDERGLILGGGGGLKKAQSLLQKGSTFHINGDEVFLPKDPLILEKLWKTHHDNNNIATLLCIEHPLVGTQFGGVWVDQDHKIHGFGKSAPQDEKSLKGLHYIGYLVVSEKIFDYLPEGEESNLLYDGITKALSDGHKAEVLLNEGQWFETGNPSDYLKATQELLKLSSTPYLKALLERWGGPFEISQDHKLFAAKNAKFGKSLKVDNFAVIGSNSKVADGIHLKGTVIGSNVNVEYQQSFEDQLILA